MSVLVLNSNFLFSLNTTRKDTHPRYSLGRIVASFYSATENIQTKRNPTSQQNEISFSLHDLCQCPFFGNFCHLAYKLFGSFITDSSGPNIDSKQCKLDYKFVVRKCPKLTGSGLLFLFRGRIRIQITWQTQMNLVECMCSRSWELSRIHVFNLLDYYGIFFRHCSEIRWDTDHFNVTIVNCI